MQWMDQYVQIRDGFSRLDWNAIDTHLGQQFPQLDQNSLWCDVARDWVRRLSTELSADYRVHESARFIILSANPDRFNVLMAQFMERSLKRILHALRGIAADEGLGKHVVLALENQDDYYRYIGDLMPDEGTFGMSSGMYINRGYGHFVFPYSDLDGSELVSVHELTHALVEHLPLPLWLNEGLAVGMENLLTAYRAEAMDKTMLAKHHRFWTTETIQLFWSGESFSSADEGQELSYHLAQFVVNSLSQDYAGFVEFANQAHYNDAGEAALVSVYDASLQNVIEPLLGAGDWLPQPASWPSNEH